MSLPMSTQTTPDKKGPGVHDAEAYDNDTLQNEVYQTSESRQQIGTLSAIFLIFNRMIGTGIFATPSTILSQSGSVGLSLIMWFAGMLIAAAGMAVYLEFGTGLPRNGGEKNYLEFVYTRPRFLVTGLYTGYVVLLGWAGSNSIVFGEYILNAADVEVTRWNQRGVGLACITSAFLIHGLALKWGLRLQNLLGAIKLIVLLIIIIAGFAALGGHLQIEKPDNFSNAFEGTTGSAYGVVNSLYNVIWSYIGYSNANYAMSEMKNPIRTLKIAAPTAIAIVGVLYMLANIAYFAAVPKADILSSGRILAASFFRNVFGPRAERALSVFVALSAFGNVLSVIFSQGRLVQELGREGILPFSRLWASNWPFDAPFMGLFEHWCVSVIIMLAPPPGDAYNFVINLISYPLSIINVFVSLALLYLHLLPHLLPHLPLLLPYLPTSLSSLTPNPLHTSWSPPLRFPLIIPMFFLLSNIYLVIAPFIPPETAAQSVYETLPYYLHCVVAWGIFAAGGVYWVVWAKVLPWWGGYRVVKRVEVGDDGWSRSVFGKVKDGLE